MWYAIRGSSGKAAALQTPPLRPVLPRLSLPTETLPKSMTTPPQDPQSTPASDSKSTDQDETSWIWSLDRRYQQVYGNVTTACLIAWVMMASALFWLVGLRWMLLILLPVSMLLMLFVMRAVIHARGKPLYEEAEMRAASQENFDAAIARARALTPSPAFFLTLTDGALARHRRQLAAQKIQQK